MMMMMMIMMMMMMMLAHGVDDDSSFSSLEHMFDVLSTTLWQIHMTPTAWILFLDIVRHTCHFLVWTVRNYLWFFITAEIGILELNSKLLCYHCRISESEWQNVLSFVSHFLYGHWQELKNGSEGGLFKHTADPRYWVARFYKRMMFKQKFIVWSQRITLVMLIMSVMCWLC